jgi:transcriptional regulator with XRE-family HTH domain
LNVSLLCDRKGIIRSVANQKLSGDWNLIIGAQIRAGRALLNWSAETLAQKAQLGVATVRRGESADGAPSMTSANLAAIQRALEAAGVEFTNGGQPGVRLRGTGGTIPGNELNASNDE